MEVQQVLQFLHKNGFLEAEFALKQDISDKGACDFEKFLFPMNLPLPPVRVPASAGRRGDGSACGPGLGRGSGSDSSGDEEFKSLGSSTTGTGVCSSEFTNPYGRRSTSQAGSDSSSERLSQFGTAREYQDFDMQTDLWYDDKDDGHYMTPSFLALDPFGCPSEDKFITTTDTWNQPRNQGFQSEENEKQTGSSFQLIKTSIDDSDVAQVKDYYDFDRKINPDVGIKWDLVSLTDGSNGSESDLKVTKDKITNSGREKDASRSFGGRDASIKDFKTPKTTEENFLHDNGDGFRVVEDDLELLKGSQELIGDADEHESATPEDVSYWETNENEYEVFELRIIHRKNRTGFEENKDLPIVLNTIIAGRYYITEYLGSAAFSKVVQAHDIQTGVDVCLKIIKNDKDFFDQSLDEIKLLKYVNKHDPSDKHHILRLYDYFYHQEHLFIVCELLRANLYEFQKYNLESGGEPYFTMSRMQAIARQSLEALEFLHGLGIIHCDLKPENILIKSYSRCQIKVIDLGSSCFQTDNLSLYVQSRSYRAPEVILGLPYDPKIDVWSLGCILAELCSGEVLFPNEAVAMLLARMIGLLGPIDLEMLLRGEDTHKYFTKEYDLYRINEENNEMEYVIPEESSLEEEMPVLDSGFINFLKYLLQINPRRRPTAKEALQHPWLSMPY